MGLKQNKDSICKTSDNAIKVSVSYNKKLFQIKYAQHKLKKGIFLLKNTGINYPLKIIDMKLFGKALKYIARYRMKFFSPKH